MFVGWFFSSVRNFIYPSWPVRIAFHLGEDEDPRFEVASRISAARPGPKPRRCGGADRKGIREGGPGLGLRRRDAGRMPRGASRDCLRPRKPPTPPAAAEASNSHTPQAVCGSSIIHSSQIWAGTGTVFICNSQPSPLTMLLHLIFSKFASLFFRRNHIARGSRRPLVAQTAMEILFK